MQLCKPIRSRLSNRKIFPGKLFACLILFLIVTATRVMASEASLPSMPASEVWVPAEAVASDASPSVSRPTSSRYQVRLVDYKASITPDPISPAPRLTDSAAADGNLNGIDYSNPGLIVPLDQINSNMLRRSPVVSGMPVSETIVSGPMLSGPTAFGTMVPGSLRVLPTSEPMVVVGEEAWHWQILPSGLLWHSYLAGPKEPRISSTFFRVRHEQDYWDATVGGRVSLLRYGSSDPRSPEGVEVQLEGAAFPRLTLDYERDLVASDYRFGFPLVYRRGSIETKFAYYHISAHLGDEYLITHPGAMAKRINYSRDALTLALGYYPWRDLRLYAEVGYAVVCDGGSRPWEFQFGADYSPVRPTSIWGAPFLAINGHLHQELNYGGGLTCQAGVQWRGQTGRLLRAGFQYFNGMSEQYQFYRQFEQQLGGGIWYDF